MNCRTSAIPYQKFETSNSDLGSGGLTVNDRFHDNSNTILPVQAQATKWIV